MTPEQIAELKAALEQKVADGLLSATQANTQLKEQLGNLTTIVELVKSKLAVSLPGVDESKKKEEQFSIARAWYAIKTGDWKPAGFEKEVFDQTREKASSTGTGAAGGYIVPVEYTRTMIEQLYAQSAAMKMGVTRLNPTSFPLEMPKMTGGAVAYWADEMQELTESEGTFGKITMSPKYLTAYCIMSDRMINYSDPGIEALMRRDIIRRMDLALDYGILFGDGQNSSPIGIKNQPGIQTLEVHADGDDPTYDFLLDMEGKIEDSNALEGDLGFISNPAVFRKMKKQKVAQFSTDPGGQPIFAPIMRDAALQEAIGKFAASTQIPKTLSKGATNGTLSSMFYGNWAEVLVPFWGSLVLSASNIPGFRKNQTHLKAVMEADVGVRHGESFVFAPYVRTA